MSWFLFCHEWLGNTGNGTNVSSNLVEGCDRSCGKGKGFIGVISGFALLFLSIHRRYSSHRIVVIIFFFDKERTLALSNICSNIKVIKHMKKPLDTLKVQKRAKLINFGKAWFSVRHNDEFWVFCFPFLYQWEYNRNYFPLKLS